MMEKDNIEDELKQKEEATWILMRETAINLTTRVCELSTESLRHVTEVLREYAGKPNHQEFATIRRQLLRQVFRDIRGVFECDSRGIDTTKWPHNFFKLALFEPYPSIKDATSLRRTYFDYPQGIEPHDSTEFFDIIEDRHSSVVRAFLHQTIDVIENVKSENKKSPDAKRWISKRQNQEEDYESMFSAAIVSGIKDAPERKCLGVLVVDTNRKEYFQEDRDFQTFLGYLLNPFRTLLTLIIEMDTYFISRTAEDKVASLEENQSKL